jgi:uncharacterized membrane protein (Fun14 family)
MKKKNMATEKDRNIGLGLFLLFISGYRHQTVYQHILALLGLSFIISNNFFMSYTADNTEENTLQ